MDRLDFLRGALPPGARYSLRLIKRVNNANGEVHDIVKNRFFSLYEDVDGAAQAFSDDGWNVYYSTAGFGAGGKADAGNAVSKRELYVDIDCGANKAYTDKPHGLQALKDFAAATGLPRPTIIDSGNGLHAHWYFVDPVPVHEWKTTATALKEACVKHGFLVDGVCTADVVRVLRVPGTINTKGGGAVTLLTPVKHYLFDKLRSILGTPVGDMFAQARERTRSVGGSTEAAKLLNSNRTNKFQAIWIRSVNGNGCAQIQNAIRNADTLPEPAWRGVLSIAQFCEDRDWAIHEVSKAHPNYDPEVTEQKAALTKGPYTCETFQGMDTAALCKGCAHAEKITSPIQLGTEIVRAEPSKTVEKNGVKYDISYPDPFFRGKHGGVYIYQQLKGEDSKSEVVVYTHDLYVYARRRDPDLGDVACVRHHLPSDGVREFMVPQKDVGAVDRLRDRLSEQGVTVFTVNQILMIQRLFALQIQELQFSTKAEDMHARFGWTRRDTFVIGDREYTKEGVRRVPTAKVVENYVRWFEPKGTLDEWKVVARAYEDQAFDMHAFGVLAGFGSALMNISPESGAVINYYSKKSGTGKTTILRMVNSIFGDPKALMKDAQDTPMSKVHRMGLYNGIPLSLDEMTNSRPEELSALAYGATQGRPRNRMEAGKNAERVNDLSWKLISIWSSNASIEDRLSIIKLDPQGEMARIIEIYLQTPVPDNVLTAQKIFNKLSDNYGHAGDIFMRYVVPNLEAVTTLWKQVRDKVYGMQDWSQTERFRLNGVICAITAGIITNKLELTNYNISRILKSIVKFVKDIGEEMRAKAATAIDTIGTFISRNAANILIVNDTTIANNLQNRPLKEPRGALVIRYEPDTKRLFISQRDFNLWCAESFLNARELKTQFLSETGRPLISGKKRMGKGWDADFGPMHVYVIEDATKILGVEELSYGGIVAPAFAA